VKLTRSAAAGGIAALLVLATAAVGATPVLDATTRAGATGATLARSTAYTVLSPVCELLDALTVLSLQQHAALFVSLVALIVVWRTLRARRHTTSATHETVVGIVSLAALVAVYAVGILVPRPMAALRVHDRDAVVIDFHSHTNHSRDAHRTFTVARNRAWHTATGFDVAYVSDHKSIAGAIDGARGNASHPGETILLPSLESRDHAEHVLVLGVDTTVAPDTKGEWHDPAADSLHPPILVLTVPGHLSELPPNEVTGVARTMAIELSDGAPKGINVLQRNPESIYALARRLDLALVAGSDNHGWGSTAVGWSVMRIPGWRSLSPAALDASIQRAIRTQRSRAARVYVRDAPDPGRSIALLSLTLPAVIWRTVVDLTWGERVSWLCWIVAAVSIASVPSSRAARDTTLPAARRNPDTA
jgi:hypothetical protein